ncbi:hypothetical protein BWZ22_12500 [Seonamhaeicola sp. S2-3]|uniref:hypothetical protein n=1 Tax=Seonamhaeicola sp. S2-3 TaxID=1936081 RepID=UPI000972B916|nr:hypothetical protein [Seonamhaeicola sp. S2-3]APY12000.1 hypothetical protein BWZ22_12500 [Seonamhaeicola sp. S2-3]
MRAYKIYFSLLVLVFQLNLFAQVGIGTATPKPSSILDVESTTQGMLTPRMTTAQKNAIATPAEGLLVFDTDENLFYYYSGSVWLPLSTQQRDNYKLVKSAADLADELTVGGGTEYLLTANTLYEINGTITLAVPINLNDAYLTGRDTNEDVLVGTGTLFQGNTGGSIRSLTLTAPGGTVFSLTGTGVENLILRDGFIVNSGSVGIISGFNLVFNSILQFVNNAAGITYTNIHQLLLNSEGWDGTNAGTYQTMIGDFEVIAKQGGFTKVTGTNVGFDVTGVTSITGGATFADVAFYGGGNYINGTSPYSGYNFTRDWDVNCPGLPVETDGAAAGNFYYNGDVTSGFSQTISNGIADEVQGSGTFVTNNLFRFTSAGGNNRLVYDGVKERQFQVNASLSVRVNGAATNFYAFYIAKNGSVITESNAVVYIDNDNQIQNVAINTNTNLANGDYIEVYAQRLTGGGNDNLIVFSENVSIK